MNTSPATLERMKAQEQRETFAAEVGAGIDAAAARFLKAGLTQVPAPYKSKEFYAQLITHIRNDAERNACMPVDEKRDILNALDDCHDCVLYVRGRA